MKKIIITLILLILIPLTSCTQNNATDTIADSEETIISPEKIESTTSPDIRNINWGMSREEVSKLETATYNFQQGEFVFYETTICGLSSNLIYAFNDNDELYQVIYQITEEHTSENLYINDYDNLKDEIQNKYGTPDESGETWIDDLYKDDPDDKGFALMLGDLIIKSIWYNDDVTIGLVLSGDNYEINHLLGYTSTEYEQSSSTNSNFGI